MRLIQTLFLCCLSLVVTAQTYRMQKGLITFVSDAPLEIIKASTHEFKALYEPTKKQFAVVIPMNTFKGFNSELQLDHYNENYLETEKYPEAKFVGKFIEVVDVSKKGRYEIRAKGKFTLHGVTIDKTILCTVQVNTEHEFTVQADFELNLAEYNIDIPKIVHKKIAENIRVKFNASLQS